MYIYIYIYIYIFRERERNLRADPSFQAQVWKGRRGRNALERVVLLCMYYVYYNF